MNILKSKSLLMPSGVLKIILLLFFLNPYRSFCQTSIDEQQIIHIGGLRQYLLIKGKDISNPVLLFLHGGPGSSLVNKTDQISGKLQQHFVVVQWDQRETGETRRFNDSPKPLTLEMFYNDTRELIDSLLEKFHQPKLYLAGYSWGSGPGFYIADKYPDLLYAYIAISPVIDQWRSDSISLAMLKEKMGKKARHELSEVKIPFENWEQLYIHRKWLMKQEGQKFVTLGLTKNKVQEWAGTWFDVWKRSCDVNLFRSLPAIKCPVYFFAGKRDYNTNSSITEEYYNYVSAPKKDLFLFSNAGHALPETNSGQFQQTIIDKILPQTSPPKE